MVQEATGRRVCWEMCLPRRETAILIKLRGVGRIAVAAACAIFPRKMIVADPHPIITTDGIQPFGRHHCPAVLPAWPISHWQREAWSHAGPSRAPAGGATFGA